MRGPPRNRHKSAATDPEHRQEVIHPGLENKYTGQPLDEVAERV